VMINHSTRRTCVALYCDPPAFADFGLWGNYFGRRMNTFLRVQSAPRTLEYSKQILGELMPEVESIVSIESPSELAAMNWHSIETLVLLWPDSNGLGWGKVERLLRAHLSSVSEIWIINGRRRRLKFGGRTYRRLLWRRRIEQSLIVNLLCTGSLLTLGSFFWAADLFRGRK
jgi:hypothetical protein